MIRTLLIEEFVKRLIRTAAFAAAAAILCIGAKAMLLRWFAEPDIQGAVNLTVGIAILLIAATAGGSTFSKTFREGPWRLLEVMPVRPVYIWLIRVFTSLAGAGIATMLLVMIQPTLLDGEDNRILLTMMALVLLLFSLACSISTVVNTSTLGSAVLSALLGLAIFFTLLAVEDFNLSGRRAELGFVTGTVCGLLSPVCLIFSLIVFTRGELDVPRRRWRNVGFGLPLLPGALLLAVAATEAGTFEANAPWKTDSIAASNTGAYVAAIQIKGRYTTQFRVVVLETASGKVLKTYDTHGYMEAAWTPDDALLVFTRSSAFRYLLHFGAQTVTAVRVFPTEETVFHRTGYRLARTLADQRGVLLLLRDATFLASTSHTLLLRMDGSGKTKELIKAPGPWLGTLSLERAFEGSALTMNGGFWRIHDEAVPMLFTVGPFRFADNQEAQRLSAWLQENRPPLRPELPPGRYLGDDIPAEFSDSSWLYYLQPDPVSSSAQLWARRKSDPGWQNLVSGIPMSVAEIRDLSGAQRRLYTPIVFRNVRARTRTGVVASLLVQHLDAIHLVVFDANSKQRYDLGPVHTIPGQGALRVIFPRPFESLIAVYRNGFEYYLRGGFYLEPGKGPPTRLLRPGNPAGNIRFLQDGGRIYGTGTTDTGFELFYEKPGEEPRLLLAAQDAFR